MVMFNLYIIMLAFLIQNLYYYPMHIQILHLLYIMNVLYLMLHLQHKHLAIIQFFLVQFHLITYHVLIYNNHHFPMYIILFILLYMLNVNHHNIMIHIQLIFFQKMLIIQVIINFPYYLFPIILYYLHPIHKLIYSQLIQVNDMHHMLFHQNIISIYPIMLVILNHLLYHFPNNLNYPFPIYTINPLLLMPLYDDDHMIFL